MLRFSLTGQGGEFMASYQPVVHYRYGRGYNDYRGYGRGYSNLDNRYGSYGGYRPYGYAPYGYGAPWGYAPYVAPVVPVAPAAPAAAPAAEAAPAK